MEQQTSPLSLRKWMTGTLQWLWSNLFMGLAVIFAGMTVLWIILAAVIWPAQDAEYQRLCLYREGQACVLEVWGPKIVRLEEETTYQFTLHRSAPPNAPVLVILSIPQEVILLSAFEEPLAGQSTLNFSALQLEETQSLRLANARRVTGLGIRWQPVFVSSQPSLSWQPDETFLIGIEPTWRGVLRQSGGGGREVPVAPLVGLLLSLGTGVYQYWLARRNEQRQQAQERKELAQKELAKIRAVMKQQDFQGARKLLEALEHSKFSAYLPEEIAQAKRLIVLALGNLDGWQPGFIPENWESETAAALLHAAKYHPVDRIALEALMRGFTPDKISKVDEKLLGDWKSIESNIGANTPLHVRRCPRPSGTEFPKISSLSTNNPFPVLAARAEDEEQYLFDEANGLFWQDRAIFKYLEQNSAVWVWGERGSGKTALALAIGRYCFLGEQCLTVFFRGLPSWMDVQENMVRHLFETILQAPFYLPTGEKILSLIAEVLLSGLQARVVLAQIEYIQSWGWPWLREAQNETQRQIWQAESQTRLRQLADAVRKADSALSESMWPAAWRAVTRSLEFEASTRLVFDIDSEVSLSSQTIAILERLERWTDYRIYPLFFTLPDTALKPYLEKWCARWSLSWDNNNLKDMLNYRLKQAGTRLSFEQLFGPEAGPAFLRYAKGNPACLGRLWNRLAAQPGARIPFSLEQVEVAARDL